MPSSHKLTKIKLLFATSVVPPAGHERDCRFNAQKISYTVYGCNAEKVPILM